MTRRLVYNCIMVGAVAMACARDAAPKPADPVRFRSAIPAVRSAAVASPALDPDTVGCGAVPKKQFLDPDRLVSEWIRRDTLGYFLGADERLFELMSCPGHLGGGDEIVVAIDPRVTRLSPSGDSASFLITYRRFGLLHTDTSGRRMVFEAKSGIDSVLVHAVSTPLGWRFPFDVANPHLSPQVALRGVAGDWVPTSRDSLAALASTLAFDLHH